MFMLVPPPTEPPHFEDITANAVFAETEEVLSTTSALHDHLVMTVTPASATFGNVVRPIVDDANRAACRLIILSELLSQVSPNREVRQAAREAETSIAAAQARKLAREDVATLVFAVYAKVTSSTTDDLDVQDRHLLSVIYGHYLRSGAGLLTNEESKRFHEASDELSKICAAAQDSFVKPEEGVWFERAELDGVPSGCFGR